MKNFFMRMRHWLIKKLGGYTEQFTPLHRQIQWTETVHLQKVRAQISVPMPKPDSAIDFKRYCEDQVLYILMRELYQSGFILWESQNDALTQKVNVRATLRVVNANDLQKYFQWVE